MLVVEEEEHILQHLLLLEDLVVEELVEVMQMQLPEHILLVRAAAADLIQIILLVQTVVLVS
jgi:hypothetical protein